MHHLLEKKFEAAMMTWGESMSQLVSPLSSVPNKAAIVTTLDVASQVNIVQERITDPHVLKAVKAFPYQNQGLYSADRTLAFVICGQLGESIEKIRQIADFLCEAPDNAYTIYTLNTTGILYGDSTWTYLKSSVNPRRAGKMISALLRGHLPHADTVIRDLRENAGTPVEEELLRFDDLASVYTADLRNAILRTDGTRSRLSELENLLDRLRWRRRTL